MSYEKVFLRNCFICFLVLINCILSSGKITLLDVADSDYDYLHPPQTNASEPVPVTIAISKLSLRSVDESDMSFSVTLEIWQIWNDYRLRYPSWSNRTSEVLDSSWIQKIWNPKLYFLNAVDGKLDNIITPSSFFWLNRDHSIYYCCRIMLKLVCQMDLKYFPHDEQICSIEMSSSTYSSREIHFKWGQAYTPPMTPLQQFQDKGMKWENYSIPWGPGTNKTVLKASIVLQRRTGYFLINVYIPTILIVIMSMLTFWIPPDAVPARVTLGVTSLLTIITKQYQAAMPSVSYIVALNVWLSCCIGFVFFSLLEFASVIALSSPKKQEKGLPPDLMLPLVMLKSNGTWAMKNNWSAKHPPVAKKPPKENVIPRRLDYMSRILFPLAFIIFAIIYWYVYN